MKLMAKHVYCLRVIRECFSLRPESNFSILANQQFTPFIPIIIPLAMNQIMILFNLPKCSVQAAKQKRRVLKFCAVLNIVFFLFSFSF